MSLRNVKTREGYDYWDKLCAIPRHAFLFSPCGKRILATPNMGTWIDEHAASEVVDQAQDEINALRAEMERLRLQLVSPGKSSGINLNLSKLKYQHAFMLALIRDLKSWDIDQWGHVRGLAVPAELRARMQEAIDKACDQGGAQ